MTERINSIKKLADKLITQGRTETKVIKDRKGFHTGQVLEASRVFSLSTYYVTMKHFKVNSILTLIIKLSLFPTS